MLAVVVTVPTDTQNSLHPLSTSSIIASHLLDFMVQGKMTEAEVPTIRPDATPSGLSVPLPPSSPIFTPNALSEATLPIYPCLGQASNNARLHILWLGSLLGVILGGMPAVDIFNIIRKRQQRAVSGYQYYSNLLRSVTLCRRAT